MFVHHPQAVRANARRRSTTTTSLHEIDTTLITLAGRTYPWVTRVALFVVYFWFGLVKLLGRSEATELAKALTAQTVGTAHFDVMFRSLAVFECVIGLLCLIPRAVRVLAALVVVHMAMVCAPLLLVRGLTWQTTLVPTMNGQYIIKNVLIIAAVFGLAARAVPASPKAAIASVHRLRYSHIGTRRTRVGAAVTRTARRVLPTVSRREPDVACNPLTESAPTLNV